MGLDRLRIIVHPQSVVHSMVEYRDGSTLAQLGPSDMRVPIASALACFVTIIGIPFGIQHLKLALIALAPIGQMVVTNHEAESGRYIR